MADIALHSYRRCPFAIRVRMTLEEKSLPYTILEENLSEPSAELIRLNPRGEVPVLIHKGQALTESSIITEYLDDIYPTPSLRPSSPLGRAQIRLWTLWCDRTLKPDLDLFKYELKSLPPAEQEALIARVREHLQKLSSALTTPYLMGPELTLADVHVFPFYRQLQKSHPDFSSLFETARLDAWLERITRRPSFERVMAK